MFSESPFLDQVLVPDLILEEVTRVSYNVVRMTKESGLRFMFLQPDEPNQRTLVLRADRLGSPQVLDTWKKIALRFTADGSYRQETPDLLIKTVPIGQFYYPIIEIFIQRLTLTVNNEQMDAFRIGGDSFEEGGLINV